jgi:hypothetical protein
MGETGSVRLGSLDRSGIIPVSRGDLPGGEVDELSAEW